jgi:hypothetical protein
MRLWAAQAISTFGARIAREGLPMAAVVTLHAGPAAVGLFAALRLAAQAAMGFFAGHLADRAPKRTLLIGADLARAAVLTLVPLAALAGQLTLTEIYIAGLLTAVFNVMFDVADHAFLPAILAPADLMDGNARLGATEAVAEVGGPALYGAIFSVLAPPVGVAVTAITYLCSAALLSTVRARGAVASTADDDETPAGLAAGFRLVLGNPLVRPLWLADVTRTFFGTFFSALYIVWAFTWLHLTPFMFGLTVACGGIGALVGAAAAPRLTRAMGAGRTILVTGVIGAAAQALVPFAFGPPLTAMAFLMAAQFFGDMLQSVAEIGSVTLRQTLIRPSELGRAAGAFASGMGAVGVAGALIGGGLGAALGPRDVLYVSVAGMCAGSLFIAFSPLRRMSAEA